LKEEETMPLKTKEELLAHYAEKDPKQFFQIDGVADMPPGDIVSVDDDGDAITGGLTHELMGCGHVRVLIPIEAKKADAIRLLRKALAWIERGALEEMREGQEQYEREFRATVGGTGDERL
jgi:hypothetical protein